MRLRAVRIGCGRLALPAERVLVGRLGVRRDTHRASAGAPRHARRRASAATAQSSPLLHCGSSSKPRLTDRAGCRAVCALHQGCRRRRVPDALAHGTSFPERAPSNVRRGCKRLARELRLTQTRNRAAKSEATRCEAAPPTGKGPPGPARRVPQGGLGPRHFRSERHTLAQAPHRGASIAERRWSPDAREQLARARRGYTGGASIPGDDRLRRGRLVGVVASRGPGRPRKTPGKTISADYSRVRPRRLVNS